MRATPTSLLNGDEVTVDGTYVKLDGVKLAWPPEPGVDLLCAATGPKTLQLSGELASATVFASCTTPQMLRKSVVSIREGQARRPDDAPLDHRRQPNRVGRAVAGGAVSRRCRTSIRVRSPNASRTWSDRRAVIRQLRSHRIRMTTLLVGII